MVCIFHGIKIRLQCYAKVQHYVHISHQIETQKHAFFLQTHIHIPCSSFFQRYFDQHKDHTTIHADIILRCTSHRANVSAYLFRPICKMMKKNNRTTQASGAMLAIWEMREIDVKYENNNKQTNKKVIKIKRKFLLKRNSTQNDEAGHIKCSVIKTRQHNAKMQPHNSNQTNQQTNKQTALMNYTWWMKWTQSKLKATTFNYNHATRRAKQHTCKEKTHDKHTRISTQCGSRKW